MGFVSSNAYANKLGSAKSGTSHFIKQRVSAIFMIFLLFWFVITVISILKSPMQELPWIISSPFSILGAILFVGISLYHATLGLCMIAEDYISTKFTRYAVLIFVYGFNILTCVAGLVSVFTIYILSRMV